MTTRLNAVPDPPRRDVSELGNDEAVACLRELMAVTRSLCDALADYLGPERRAAPPQLHVIPGGKTPRKQLRTPHPEREDPR